jgi:hypothetical protein
VCIPIRLTARQSERRPCFGGVDPDAFAPLLNSAFPIIGALRYIN